MNIGDGLLFKVENGKPKLILLSHADAERNPVKHVSIKPRAAKILSSRQPRCVEEEVQDQERPPRPVTGSHREGKCKASGSSLSSVPNKTSSEGRNGSLTSSKTYHRDRSVKVAIRGRDGVSSNKHKLTGAIGPAGANGKAGQPPNTRGGKKSLKQIGVENKLVCLTTEQLEQILNAVKSPINGQNEPEEPPAQEDPAELRSDSVAEEGREIREEDKGGGADADRSPPEKDNGLTRSLFSWLEERESDSRANIDAKKAQWKRELDEQVALKQQLSASSRLRVEEYAESVLSVQSSISYREQPAAVRSNLRLGEVTPMEELSSAERKEEQRRRWLQELDHQREEAAQRRKQEKLLKSQPEDHERWAAHFDSHQRRPLVRTPAASAPPPGRLNGSERGEWDPSSSLSLAWEATSSCGAESVLGARVGSTSGVPTRTSYLRTMTSLLDPAQLEERERRRLKQLEQQRAIEAQMEERRRHREQEEAKKRQEEEKEERRVAQEREKLQKLYDLETQRKKQKEEVVLQAHCNGRQEETSESSTTRESGGLETTGSSTSSFKDMAVQTEETPPLVPPPPPPPRSAAPSSRSRSVRTGKENVCQPAGDPYGPFARTERSRRDKKRPEWNTHRPSRQFVPASERYPVALQRNRQENRLRRQAELLALQERTRQARTEALPQNQVPRLGPTSHSADSVGKVETASEGISDPPARGPSPPVPAIQHEVQSQQASRSSSPVLEFVPYIRTNEVFNLNPLEPADTPPPQTHSGAPPESSACLPVPSHRDRLLHPELLRNTHTHRQQEILRGLAQLRQGLLQKQKELEMDLNPLWSRLDNEQLLPSTKRNKT